MCFEMQPEEGRKFRKRNLKRTGSSRKGRLKTYGLPSL